MKKVKSIDEYINDFSKDEFVLQRERFIEFRKIANELLRKQKLPFEETIAYNMPAFRWNGKIVCCFAICKKHLGYYPYSGKVLDKLKNELDKLNLEYSSGALKIPYSKKINKSLITKMLKLRQAEILESLQKK